MKIDYLHYMHRMCQSNRKNNLNSILMDDYEIKMKIVPIDGFCIFFLFLNRMLKSVMLRLFQE